MIPKGVIKKTIKTMFKTLYKAIDRNWGFWIFSIASILLIAISFFLPPMGEINPSVIKAVGELFGFASLWTIVHGINKGCDVALKHNDTELKIDTPDDK